jgi:peroxiredoxin
MRSAGAASIGAAGRRPQRCPMLGHGTIPAQPVAPPIGASAPALTLPDLRSKSITLADFRGRSTLLLFWNPGCGFCQRMLDDLKAWEARPRGAPQLLVVSTGTVEANQAMGLRAPIVLDQGFSAGRQFGATGTPMAVLIDAQGRIASEVAAGAPAVLALANDPHQLKLVPA